jgi:hypothetical protein
MNAAWFSGDCALESRSVPQKDELPWITGRVKRGHLLCKRKEGQLSVLTRAVGPGSQACVDAVILLVSRTEAAIWAAGNTKTRTRHRGRCRC